MIGLHVNVLAGALREPGVVVGRVTAHGRTSYMVRFADYRVRSFEERWVRLDAAPVVRVPVRLRLATINGVPA